MPFGKAHIVGMSATDVKAATNNVDLPMAEELTSYLRDWIAN